MNQAAPPLLRTAACELSIEDTWMFYRLVVLFTVCSALVAAVDASAPVMDMMPASERPDGQGGTIRLRVVSKMDIRRPLRLIEHQGVNGTLETTTMVADHLLVALYGNPAPAEVQALAEANGCTVRRRIGVSDLWLFAFPVREPGTPDHMRDLLAALPQVRRVEADWQVRSHVIPNDAEFAQQWSLNNRDELGNLTGADIKAPAAWNITTGNRRVVVGVIDTGIAYDHPELAANIWANPGETGIDPAGHDKRTNAIDDDGNGYIDDWRGWNFVVGTNDPQDDHGHGTHCAGIIGATGNDTLGITGVCWQVSLVGMKFLDRYGYGFTADAVEAIQYADRMGFPITSLSWGSPMPSPSLEEAMASAASHGMLLVASAGNTGRDFGRQPNYPAAFSIANLINVASTNRWDYLSYFSAYSATSVHIAAPGEDIISTVPDGHAVYSGTSMAAPHVAGVAALVKTIRPTITAGDLKQVLMDGVEQLPKLAHASLSGGRLDAARSLSLASGSWLRATDWTMADQDANGVVEPGEWCDIRVVLRNDGLTTSPAGSLRIDPVGVVTDMATFSDPIAVPPLAPGSSMTTTAIRLSIAQYAPAPHDFQIRASIAYGEGWEARLPLTIPIRRSAVLRGVVRQIHTDAPVAHAWVHARGALERSVLSAADGSYSIILPQGDYTVEAEIPGQKLGLSRTLRLPPSQTLDLLIGAPQAVVTPSALSVITQGDRANVLLPITNAGDLPLHWTMEVDPEFQAEGQWHRSQRRSPNGEPVWWFGQEETGTFATGEMSRGSLTIPTVEVPSSGGWLNFSSWRNTEPLFPDFTDICAVEVSVDGGETWTETLATIQEQNWYDSWTPYSLSLDKWAGKTIRLRFTFDSVDAFANEGEGWYVGAIVACGQRLEPRGWAAPTSGTVPSGTTNQIQLTIDTHGLASGHQTVPVRLRSDDPAAPLTLVAIPFMITPAAVTSFVGLKIREVTGDGDGWAENAELIALDLEFSNAGDLPVNLEVSLNLPSDMLEVQSATAMGTISANSRKTLTGIQFRVRNDVYYNVWLGGEIQVFDGTTEKSHPIVVRLAQRETLTGHVIDAEGKAVHGAKITIEARFMAPATRTTGADGRFVFADLLPEELRLTASQPGRSPEIMDVVPQDQTLTIILGERRLRVDTISITSVLQAEGHETQILSLAATGDVPVTCRILSSALFAEYLMETSLDTDGPTFTWANLPDSGTNLPVTTTTQGPFPIGFSFPFYGTKYDTFFFSGAGWLSFTDQHDQYYGWYGAPPHYALPRALIAPWMGTPMVMDPDSGYRLSGNQDHLLIETKRAKDLFGAEATHQTMLAADGTITVHYQQVKAAFFMVAGIQNAPASKGLGIYGSYGVSPLMNPDWKPTAASSVRYRPASQFMTFPPHLTTESDGGVLVTIPARTSLEIPLTLSAHQKSVGTHRDRLVILSNVLDHPWISVPVTMTVTKTDSDSDTVKPEPKSINDGGSPNGCGLGSGLGLLALGGILSLRRRRGSQNRTAHHPQMR